MSLDEMIEWPTIPIPKLKPRTRVVDPMGNKGTIVGLFIESLFYEDGYMELRAGFIGEGKPQTGAWSPEDCPDCSSVVDPPSVTLCRKHRTEPWYWVEYDRIVSMEHFNLDVKFCRSARAN